MIGTNLVLRLASRRIRQLHQRVRAAQAIADAAVRGEATTAQVCERWRLITSGMTAERDKARTERDLLQAEVGDRDKRIVALESSLQEALKRRESRRSGDVDLVARTHNLTLDLERCRREHAEAAAAAADTISELQYQLALARSKTRDPDPVLRAENGRLRDLLVVREEQLARAEKRPVQSRGTDVTV